MEAVVMNRFPLFFLVVASLLVPVGAANAAPITGLFNTGVGLGGVLLVGGDGTVDPHWDVVAGPGLGAPVDAVTYKHPAYAADGPNSRWISVNANGSSAGSGTYTFQTTFSLAGFDPSATSITMSCGTDNLLTSWSLNGVNQSGDCDGFSSFPTGTGTAGSGFLGGLNTIQFLVLDQGQPMAFRAEFISSTRDLETTTGTTSPGSPVPEPGTGLLLMTGMAAARWFRRRRV